MSKLEYRKRRLHSNYIVNEPDPFPTNNVCRVIMNDFVCDRVVELVLAEDLLVVLFTSGKAFVFCRETGRKVGPLLDFQTQVVKSACYNKWNQTVFVVWHSRSYDLGLRIHIRHLDSVRQGAIAEIAAGTHLNGLIVPYPGFVEFEEANARIVTSTPNDALFRFWDMIQYDEVFSLSNEQFRELRLSGGTVAFFEIPNLDSLSLRLCRISDGEILTETSVALLPNRSLEFLELCGSTLLIKQNKANLRAHELLSGICSRAADTRDFAPNAVTFLPISATLCTQKLRKTNKIGLNDYTHQKTAFISLTNAKLELYECYAGFLERRYVINLVSINGVENRLQVVHTENLALIYAKNTESGRSGGFLKSLTPVFASAMAFYERKKNGYDRFALDSRVLETNDANQSEENLSRIMLLDLTTGHAKGAISVPNLDEAHVMTYDSKRRELYVASSTLVISLGPGFADSASENIERFIPRDAAEKELERLVSSA